MGIRSGRDCSPAVALEMDPATVSSRPCWWCRLIYEHRRPAKGTIGWNKEHRF